MERPTSDLRITIRLDRDPVAIIQQMWIVQTNSAEMDAHITHEWRNVNWQKLPIVVEGDDDQGNVSQSNDSNSSI